MNTKHPNIKITSEFEENYSFPFLDVKNTRRKKRIVLLKDIFKKNE